MYALSNRLKGPMTRARKRQKIDNSPLIPLTFGMSQAKAGKDQWRPVRILLDSGASGTVVSKAVAQKLHIRKEESTTWTTAAGKFRTAGKARLLLKLPELSPSAAVKVTAHVHEGQVGAYDIIIGRDVLQETGIDLVFSEQRVKWPRMHAELPMKPANAKPGTHFHVQNDHLDADAERLSKILDAKYAPCDLKAFVSEIKSLSNSERTSLFKLLKDYEKLFDGSLGHWRGKPYKIKLRDDARPYHGRPYSVPRAYEKTLRLELERLCKIGVLKRINRSEWAFPSFIIPKKDKTVRFINDLRELNKRIKRVPFPLPRIQDILLRLQGFTYATALDLNMGYYHIRLDDASKKLCTLIFPWGKYEMQCLPMGLCNSPDIFQEKMSELMYDLDFVRTYIDDLLIITNGSYEDHLDKVEQVLQRLQHAGLKVNANKSFFAQTELEYLGYYVTRDGIRPQQMLTWKPIDYSLVIVRTGMRIKVVPTRIEKMVPQLAIRCRIA